MSSESCHCPTKEDRKLGFVERDVQLHFKFTLHVLVYAHGTIFKKDEKIRDVFK